MSKSKYKTNNETICITIPIETDEYLRKFILDNSYMYNQIRNDFVEEANKYKGEYNMYWNFDPWDFHTKYYNDHEVSIHRYDYYCVGLSTQVADNFISSRNTIRTTNNKIISKKLPYSLGKYHFKRFDYNKYSFRIKLNPTIKNNKIRSRLKIKSKNEISFLIRGNYHNDKHNRDKETISIHLKEKLYDDILNEPNPIFTKYYTTNGIINECRFCLSDIKDICFKYECGNYYIQLFTNVLYNINKESLKYSKNNICGIDTGIRHPITIYDGNKTMYLSMDDKTTRKIHYLERRINRLKHYRDLKYNANIERTGYMYSNNTIKLTKKIRRLYRKIINIKIHWIRNICKQITTTYSSIVVDTYECPNANEDKSLPKIARRRINYANRFHNMYYFNEFLKHDCIKYGCEYIESPDYTTCTCSVCNHINPHLKLSDKYLTCEKCGNVIERDMNAARNCYFYALEKSKVV